MSKPKIVKIRVVRMGLRVRSSLRAGDTPVRKKNGIVRAYTVKVKRIAQRMNLENSTENPSKRLNRPVLPACIGELKLDRFQA